MAENNGNAKLRIPQPIMMAVLAGIVSLQVWVVRSLYLMQIDYARFTSKGPIYTADMARADQLELKTTILSAVASDYPPQWLRADMDDLTLRVQQLERAD